jgi:ferredoxin-NADP reductase
MELTSQTIGMAAGWLGLGWVALQGLQLALRTMRRRSAARRRETAQLAEFRRRVDSAARAARAQKAVPDWEGWRPFRVAAIVDEAADVKSFYLAPADARPLTPFSPGQYVTFRLPVAGSDPPLVRCYSLSERPREDYFRCTIKRIGRPPGRREAASGRGSGFFHTAVKVGDLLELRAPAGTFFIDPLANDPIVLIGAGIGVTPLVSMLEAIVHSGRRRDVTVLLGFRNGREQAFKERLTQIVAEHRHIRLHVSYSAPLATDVLYRDYNHVGRMTMERVRAILPSNNYRFFVCGPGAMMESLVPALWDWGVPESHVHFEAFGPASVKGVSGTKHAGAPLRCAVKFERSARTITWDGSAVSLLEFAEAAGIALASGCRAGSCGECLVRVRSGEITTLKRPGFTVPENHCLACISAPAGELVLDA